MAASSPHTLRAVDAHAAGRLVRLATAGLPRLSGRRLADRARLFAGRHGAIRDALMREPRGHDGITLAVLTEPVDERADAGVLFFTGERSTAVPGEALLAVGALGGAYGLIGPRQPDRLRLDTLYGLVELTLTSGAAERPPDSGQHLPLPPQGPAASFEAPAARVVQAGLELRTARRAVRVDLASCGELFLIADAESAGVPLTVATLPAIRAGARAILAAARDRLPPGPADGLVTVLLTGPADSAGAAMRAVAVQEDGTVDRGPAANALGAAAAVLSAMGLLRPGDAAILEGLIGTTIRGEVIDRTPEGTDGVRVRIHGRAHIVAEHVFYVDPADPLGTGTSWDAAGA